MEENGKEARRGLALATAVYLVWGVMPAYWRLLRDVGPAAIIAHRALWAFAFTAAALALVYRPKRIMDPLKGGKTLLLCVLASLALLVQWVAYLLAVVTDQLVDLSLGYFIYPIVAALAGTLLLKERMSLAQKVSLGLACAGVLIKVIRFGSVPILALALAISFSAYSLIKRKIKLSSVSSIFYETLFMIPFALAYAAYAEAAGEGPFLSGGPGTAILLVGGGILTAATLLMFAAGAKRIPVFTLGFLQYISPTMVLLLGVLAYGEPFGPGEWLVFGLIWISLIVSITPSALVERKSALAARKRAGGAA
jgi:chloramphenicol-sensitive protein RarD